MTIRNKSIEGTFVGTPHQNAAYSWVILSNHSPQFLLKECFRPSLLPASCLTVCSHSATHVGAVGTRPALLLSNSLWRLFVINGFQCGALPPCGCGYPQLCRSPWLTSSGRSRRRWIDATHGGDEAVPLDAAHGALPTLFAAVAEAVPGVHWSGRRSGRASGGTACQGSDGSGGRRAALGESGAGKG